MQLLNFAVSKDEWHTKMGTGKFKKNAFYLLHTTVSQKTPLEPGDVKQCCA